MKSRWVRIAAALALLGCGHSDAFKVAEPRLGPFNTGSDVRLTFNPDQDYWPAWTQDGRGILYAFVNPVGPGILADRHRCMGLLPAAGGSRIWEWCDNRQTQSDSATSFTAYALASDGRLLYVEAVAPANSASFPRQITLWLADSAAPLTRTALLTLPLNLGMPVTWLSDIAWTGPSSFIALGQIFGSVPHCGTCFTADTTFADSTVVGGVQAASGIVVVGSIVSGHATVQAVSGTEGATGYSLAENGTSIVFIHRDDTRLFKVPATGGTAVVVATVTMSDQQLLGVSCKDSTCLVAADAVTLFSDATAPPTYPMVTVGPKELRAVSLSTGVVQILVSAGTSPATPVIAAPQISPTSGDVVVQIGGVWGHLSTCTGCGTSDIHLYPGLVP